MTKEILSYKLRPFIEKGYLQERYAGKTFTIYRFLNTVFVGFVHSYPGNDQVGILLTGAEVCFITNAKSVGAISYLAEQADNRIVFSEELLAKCNSSIKRLSLKRKLNSRHYTPDDVDQDQSWVPDRWPAGLCERTMEQLSKYKSVYLKKYERYMKRIKIFAIIALLCTAILIAGLLTKDWRDGFNPDRSSVEYDMRSDSYSHLEIDALARFAFLALADGDPAAAASGTYYLWGNSETEEYGILKFADAADELRLIDSNQDSVVFDQPITLYGYVHNSPSRITDLFGDLQDEDEFFEIDQFGTTIDSPSFIFPNSTLGDYSEDAVEFLQECGIEVDLDSDLGKKYIAATIEPEKETLPINKALNNVIIIDFCLGAVLYALICIYAVKADKAIKTKNSRILAMLAYEESIEKET